MNFPADLERTVRIAKALIDAALANQRIQVYLRDLTPPRLWTVAGVRSNPTCRVEWEHVVVIGGVGEALAAARHKNWGEFLGVLPLRPDDPVHWCRILYIYKSTSPYNRRVEQRKALKRILGRRHRKLVTLAARSTRRDFLDRHLTEAGAYVIRRRLHLDPREFWRAARGTTLLDLPLPPRQLTLFPDEAL
ncbi:MAG: hypothetical protein ACYC3I_06605 [Gemmataceae bacterium]